MTCPVRPYLDGRIRFAQKLPPRRSHMPRVPNARARGRSRRAPERRQRRADYPDPALQSLVMSGIPLSPTSPSNEGLKWSQCGRAPSSTLWLAHIGGRCNREHHLLGSILSPASVPLLLSVLARANCTRRFGPLKGVGRSANNRCRKRSEIQLFKNARRA